jgi:hypothetical protein
MVDAMRIVPACSALLSILLVLACSDADEDKGEGTGSGTTTSDGSIEDGGDDGTTDGGGTGSGGGGSDTSDTGDESGTGSGGTSGASDTGSTSGETTTTASETGTTTGATTATSDTGTTTTDTTATASGTSATTTGTTTTSDTTTTTTDTGTTTTSDTGTTTSDTTTTTSYTTTTSGQAGVEYVAVAMYGGLDRIFIRKADYDADLCLSLVVVWPAGMPVPFPDVTTPAQWAVETISVSQGTTGCLDPCAGLGTPGEYADSASGYVDFVFNTPGQFPETLDVSVSMTFPPVQVWVPASDSMHALDLPVGTC